MDKLSSKQKKYLKSKAHPLRALVQIGKAGVNEQTLQSISVALDQHELVKVKFIAFKEDKEQFLEKIETEANALFVSLIGHVLTLYRENKDPEKRNYNLPN